MARSRSNPVERTPWAWAVAGACIGLLTSVLLFAPAHWLAAAIAGASDGRVLLQEPRGTVWDGSAQLVFAGGTGSRDATALPGRLRWRLRPTGSGASADLHADCCTQQPWLLTVRPRWTGAQLAVADAASLWPASLLSGLGTPWNTVQPEGQLALSTQGLQLEWVSGRLLLSGRAQLEARDMSSKLSTLKPMGSYRITVAGAGDGGPASLQIATIDGSLQLNGSGQWVGSRLHFDGVAQAAPDRVDALSNLLSIIGRRDGARSIIKVG